MPVPKVKLRQRKGKKDVSYFIDFSINGKRHRLHAGTNKKTALEICQNTQTQLILGHYDIVKDIAKTISLKELINNFISSKRNHIRPTSLKRYENYLDKFQDYMDNFFPGPSLNIRDIKTRYIVESFNYLIENKITKWEPKTVNGLRTTLIQLFNYGIKEGYQTDNPAKDTKKYKVNQKNIVEFFTDEELDKIWKELDPFWIDPLKFILHTGLRKGEWINLKWENVNLSENNPTISIVSSGTWKTKTGESRVIPLNKTAFEIIKKQKNKNPEFVFTQKNGANIHPDRAYHSLKATLKKLGLKGDIHKFRHTFASKLVMKGRPLYDVQKLLGHRDIQTTMIYAHLSPDYLKDSVKELD